MPIYEYKCRSCGNEFEQLVRPGKGPAPCPSCQSSELDRMLSAFSVSSGDMSRRNARRARAVSATSADRIDKQVADHDYVRDHMAEKGVQIPPLDKPKSK